MASPFGYQGREITSGNSIYDAVVVVPLVFAGLACMRGLWGLMAEQLLLAEVLPERGRESSTARNLSLVSHIYGIPTNRRKGASFYIVVYTGDVHVTQRAFRQGFGIWITSGR